MSSGVTNLVTSREIEPIRRATTDTERFRSPRFILLRSTAVSSATSGFEVVPELFGQSEARAGRNVKRTRKKPSFVPSSRFHQCNM